MAAQPPASRVPRAGDLPITVPKNVLTINLRTARALGLTIPPGVLSGADVVLD